MSALWSLPIGRLSLSLRSQKAFSGQTLRRKSNAMLMKRIALALGVVESALEAFSMSVKSCWNITLAGRLAVVGGRAGVGVALRGGESSSRSLETDAERNRGGRGLMTMGEGGLLSPDCGDRMMLAAMEGDMVGWSPNDSSQSKVVSGC